jgi:hypothetical protein
MKLREPQRRRPKQTPSDLHWVLMVLLGFLVAGLAIGMMWTVPT